MRRRVAALLATLILVLAVAAPVLAEPPVGAGNPTVHVHAVDSAYTNDDCGIPLDVVRRESRTLWFVEGTGAFLKTAGTWLDIWTNPTSGKWFTEQTSGVQSYLVLDWSPARQEEIIGRTLEEDEVLLRHHIGAAAWHVRSSDGRTLAFEALGRTQLEVLNLTTGEWTWSKWEDEHGGGTFRAPEADSLCALYLAWLT